MSSTSGGLTLADKKQAAFSKNSTVSSSLLKSHMQLKESIRDNKLEETASQINSAEISVDSMMNDEAKTSLLRSKMRSSITSKTGDEISQGARVSDIFFDGDFKISAQSKRSLSSMSSLTLSDMPLLDTVLIQSASPSVVSNVGKSAVEYEID